jgi:hypothetical protein
MTAMATGHHRPAPQGGEHAAHDEAVEVSGQGDPDRAYEEEQPATPCRLRDGLTMSLRRPTKGMTTT